MVNIALIAEQTPEAINGVPQSPRYSMASKRSVAIEDHSESQSEQSSSIPKAKKPREETDEERRLREKPVTASDDLTKWVLILEVSPDSEPEQYYCMACTFTEEEVKFMFQNPMVYYTDIPEKSEVGKIVDGILHKLYHYNCDLEDDAQCTPKRHTGHTAAKNSGYCVANRVVQCAFIVNYADT